MLPDIQHKKINAVICSYCRHVNNVDYQFCTNCSYPLQDKLLVTSFYKKLNKRKDVWVKAVNAVFIARNVLYVMAVSLLLGLLVLLLPVNIKYLIAVIALILSGLFFLLALWSRREPFPAMFTAFIILVTFSAINIVSKFDMLLTTSQGLISLMLCFALLFVIIKGVQGAYRLKLFTGIK